MIAKARRDCARQLRQDSTPFEQSFWRQVRGGRFGGFKFRRQQPIGPYIADFVCQQVRLVVELDGSQHAESREYDRNRDAWLHKEGYHVFRVWNNEWSTRPEAVLEKLWQMLHEVSEPSPQPLPPNGGGASTSLSHVGKGTESEARAPRSQLKRGTEGKTSPPLSHLGRGAGGEGNPSEEVEA